MQNTITRTYKCNSCKHNTGLRNIYNNPHCNCCNYGDKYERKDFADRLAEPSKMAYEPTSAMRPPTPSKPLPISVQLDKIEISKEVKMLGGWYNTGLRNIYSRSEEAFRSWLEYCDTDVENDIVLTARLNPILFEEAYNMTYGRRSYNNMYGYNNPMEIKNVIFNDPATIVFWADGTKTVVKAQNGDKFDPEKGLAMAIAKRVFGNKGNYCNQLKKWLPKED